MTRRLAGALLVVALAWAPAGGQGAPLTFASVEQGQDLLGREDDFVAEMSPFDRAARLRTDQAVSTEQLLAHVRRQILPWEAAEQERIARAMRVIEPALATLAVAVPDPLYLVKTTGAEDADTAYTRGRAIVLPRRMLALSDRSLREVLAHELLHVLTRHDAALRDALYATIGFRRCGTLELPPALRALAVTNPDAPRHEHCIQVRVDGAPVWAMPIQLARAVPYDAARGGSVLDQAQLGLLIVTPGSATAPARPVPDAPDPRRLSPYRVPDLIAKVGRNTRYLAHPEEIVADNFALLVLGARDVPSPAVLEGIRDVLARRAAPGPAPR